MASRLSQRALATNAGIPQSTVSRIETGTMQPTLPLLAPTIFAILDAHKVEYVVIGGYAANLEGSTRVTTDVDVTPERSRRNLARLAAALRDRRGGIRVDDLGAGLPFDTSAEALATTKTVNLPITCGDIDPPSNPTAPGDPRPRAHRPALTEPRPGLRRLVGSGRLACKAMRLALKRGFESR